MSASSEWVEDHYRRVPRSKVIDIPDTPAFGKWKGLYSPKSISHPAKMNVLLVRYILERYTRPGDVVLDPMAGTFNTVVQAALMGRNGVGVEYEKWMFDVAQDTLARLRAHGQVTVKGRVAAIHGDARELSRVVRAAPVDAAVFSPPYAGPYAEEHSKAGGGKFVPVMDGSRRDYSGDPENIGHRKYGDVDAVVTSPPHEDTLRPWPRAVDQEKMGDGGRAFLDQTTYDAVVTSPPHSESVGTRAGGKMRWTPEDQERLANEHVAYSDDPDNIGNKPHGDIDAIVTSPPHGRDAEPHSEIHEKGRGPVLPRPGYDAVVTSPPYAGSQFETGDKSPEFFEEMARRQRRPAWADPGSRTRRTRAAQDAAVDAIVTSPPHGDGGQGHSPDSHPDRMEGTTNGLGIGYDAVITSPPHADTQLTQSKNILTPKNPIGEVDPAAIERGGYDAVVTSPPHGGAVKPHGVESEEVLERRRKRLLESDERSIARGTKWSHSRDTEARREAVDIDAGYSEDPDNLGNLAYGNVDAVVTSPPYAEANRGGGIAKEGYRGEHGDDPGLKDRHDRALSDDAGNISNAPYGSVDAIVTSPPYEDAQAFQRDLSEAFVGEMRRRTREGITGGKPSSVAAEVAHLERAAEGRRTTEGNIGRKSGETYLEAMFKVYQQCFLVLKPGGVCVVTVKNFVRDSKPVLLSDDTCKLLRAAGFEEVDHLYRRLRTMSFWIRNGIQRFRREQASGKIPKEWPLPYTKYEDILVWRRPPT